MGLSSSLVCSYEEPVLTETGTKCGPPADPPRTGYIPRAHPRHGIRVLSDRQPAARRVVIFALKPSGYRGRELLGDAALLLLVVATGVHRDRE